jgi:hypothetical protein
MAKFLSRSHENWLRYISYRAVLPFTQLQEVPLGSTLTLLVARRIQCSNNHDKSPKIDLDKANHVFGWFWPYSKPTFAFFYHHPLSFCLSPPT